jgi:hypothetical protein
LQSFAKAFAAVAPWLLLAIAIMQLTSVIMRAIIENTDWII